MSKVSKVKESNENPNDQKLKTRYNTNLTGIMTYEIFYNEVMKDENIEASLINDMKEDIKLMIESNDTFNNFIVLYNYLNTLNDTNNFFDFRVNNKDFKDDNGVLNKKAIDFNSTSLKRNISNKEMINRFIIDNYIINLKTENGLKIKKPLKKQSKSRLTKQSNSTSKEDSEYYKKIYDFINNKEDDENLLTKIYSLIKNFNSDNYDKLHSFIIKTETGNEDLRDKMVSSEIGKLIKTYKNLNNDFDYLLITKLSSNNFGYYIINIILINDILDEIDFFEFMMLQRILVIFNKYENVILKENDNVKNFTLKTSDNVSNTIKTAQIGDPKIIKDKLFIYFTVISLYKKIFKSESKNKFNLYKLAYESYYIKSLLNEKTSTITRLDNRVKYYNFMFKNDPITIEIDIGKTNNKFKDKENKYNKGLLHYLNIAAVCLLKDNSIEISYNGTPIENSESKSDDDDNELIELLNDLTRKSNSKELNKNLSEEFLDFISNEFFSNQFLNKYRIRIDNNNNNNFISTEIEKKLDE